MSRYLGKKRVAANLRPTFLGAWGVVAFDIAVVIWALVYSFKPLMTLFQFRHDAYYLSGVFLMLVYIVLPLGVLANGCIWAQRTRNIKEWY